MKNPQLGTLAQIEAAGVLPGKPLVCASSKCPPVDFSHRRKFNLEDIYLGALVRTYLPPRPVGTIGIGPGIGTGKKVKKPFQVDFFGFLLYYLWKMEQVVEELKRLNKSVDEILDILRKPGNKAGKILETAGAIVTVLGILSIIEILRNWLGG